MIVVDLWKAVRAGKELKNASTWANRQALTSICVVVLTFTVGILKFLGVDLPFTDEQIVEGGAAIATLLFLGNSVLSVATTKDAGVK